MNPNILYVIFSYKRLRILKECIRTIFENNQLRPNRVLVLDDGSEPELKKYLYDFQLTNNDNFPIDIISWGKNIGYANSAEIAFKIAEIYNPKKLFIIENDYIFRKNGLDTVNWLLDNNDYVKNGLGFCGYDEPGMYDKQKIEIDFLTTIPREFEEKDNLNRSIMYKPFEQDTPFGKIFLERVGNSMSTSYWNWQKIMELKKEFPTEFEKVMFRVFDKHKIGTELENKRYLNDSALSSGLSWVWNLYAIKRNINRDKYSAMYNIKPSVANSINGGPDTISGFIAKEGETFVSSPTFDWKNY